MDHNGKCCCNFRLNSINLSPRLSRKDIQTMQSENVEIPFIKAGELRIFVDVLNTVAIEK